MSQPFFFLFSFWWRGLVKPLGVNQVGRWRITQNKFNRPTHHYVTRLSQLNWVQGWATGLENYDPKFYGQVLVDTRATLIRTFHLWCHTLYYSHMQTSLRKNMWRLQLMACIKRAEYVWIQPTTALWNTEPVQSKLSFISEKKNAYFLNCCIIFWPIGSTRNSATSNLICAVWTWLGQPWIETRPTSWVSLVSCLDLADLAWSA